jgi:predicted RNA polymerase sigma factor
MTEADGNPQRGKSVEHLLREITPQVLGALTRRHRDFAAAEDAVQEALLDASMQWPLQGVPQNPAGWLYDPTEETHVQAVEEFEPEQDDTLVLLFMCSHPALTPTTAVALMLRAVGGLTTREIGAAFFVSEATMAQRISRAKQTIIESKVSFELPSAAERAQRLQSVLHVLYLIFNEGYASSSGHALQRVDLSTEAIRLARALQMSTEDSPEIPGLLALMLLTDARRAARTDAGGELIPLDEQDRALWDRQLIEEGVSLVEQAMAKGRVGPYQVQAAIAALHDRSQLPRMRIGRRSMRSICCSSA